MEAEFRSSRTRVRCTYSFDSQAKYYFTATPDG